MEPVLQVALDHMHLKRALLAAKEAVDGGADWLEAGTPLVKSEGIEVVRQLKKSFPGKTIVADLKTMDTGAFEVEIAARAGADVSPVRGVRDDATILEAVRAARRYGWKIMVDLMRVADKPARAKELEKLGVDYLNMHVSIDEQMIAHTPLQELKAVAAATSIPVAVAGGVNSETVGQALKAGASIVIVGGAIIKAEDVADATRTIKKAILLRTSIPTGLYKKYTEADVGDAFRKVSTPNLADAMQKRGVMTGLVPRIRHGTKLVGTAVTVKTADGDWAKPVEAIDRAKSGDVIVIDVGGGPTAGWGELAANSCLVEGVARVGIDGAVRDLATGLQVNFPGFSRHAAPHAGEPKGPAGRGGRTQCGGGRRGCAGPGPRVREARLPPRPPPRISGGHPVPGQDASADRRDRATDERVPRPRVSDARLPLRLSAAPKGAGREAGDLPRGSGDRFDRDRAEGEPRAGACRDRGDLGHPGRRGGRRHRGADGVQGDAPLRRRRRGGAPRHRSARAVTRGESDRRRRGDGGRLTERRRASR